LIDLIQQTLHVGGVFLDELLGLLRGHFYFRFVVVQADLLLFSGIGDIF